MCYALPRVESLHVSALTFDKSRAMIRKVERAVPAPIGFFVPFASSTSDWSSFSESMTSTIKMRRLHLKEIVIEGSRITRIADAKRKPAIDLTGLTVTPGWIDTHVHVTWYFNKEGRYEAGGRGSSGTRGSTRWAGRYAAVAAWR